ncbi:MAG: hypothetical protein LZF86_140016 [Nitrospira sp.]|nr:MAG: hypothetical protein LZF86_140016 [Nitrospira sp.]
MRPDLPAIADDAALMTTEQLAEWKQKGAHILAPVTLQTIPAMHRPVVVVVQIDPNPDNKEVYPQKGGGVSLSAIGWEKLADAMGIQWDAKQCGRRDGARDPNRCEYRMVGRVKALDGTWRQIMGDKEIRMENVIEELTDSKREKAQKYLDDPKDGPGFLRAFPDTEAWIREQVRQEALQIKKHLLSRAQTGAMARAIKSIGIRETYKPAELAKPFVFPKLVAEFDLNHPEDRAFLRAQAAGAIDQLYQPVQRATEPQVALVALPEQTAATAPAIEFHAPPDSPPVGSLPALDDGLRMDFSAADPKGQKEVLDRLIQQKGYRGKVTGDMEKWSAPQRSGFFERLVVMPDVQKPGGDPLPFE